MMVDFSAANSVPELLGDPAALAEYQFRLAADLCGSCRDYHALWPYRRLAGMVFGVEDCADIVEPLIRRYTPVRGSILIAGAADAGTTAQALRAATGLSAALDVADRCPTPLAVCRRFAERIGAPVQTLALDLEDIMLARRYDVVLLHSVLQFLAPADRACFVRKLRAGMNPTGALIVVERQGGMGVRTSTPSEYAEIVLSRLARRGIVLPEDEETFRARVETVFRARNARAPTSFSPGQVRQHLVDAGFSIAGGEQAELQRVVTLPTGEVVTLEVAAAVPDRD